MTILSECQILCRILGPKLFYRQEGLVNALSDMKLRGSDRDTAESRWKSADSITSFKSIIVGIPYIFWSLINPTKTETKRFVSKCDKHLCVRTNMGASNSEVKQPKI
jgi:hypothetical protein